MAKSSLITKLRALLTKISDSTAELTKMFIKSELNIGEHCDSLRQQVDIARETALENIHKASNTLMNEIDAYERECLSSWRAVNEYTEQVVEDVSKGMRASIAEHHAYLQSLQASATELILLFHFKGKMCTFILRRIQNKLCMIE